MCTAINFTTKCHYFGRNLDLDCSYGEELCIIPRKFPLRFRKKETQMEHYAIIGMVVIAEGEPLLYDGANEYGLAMAGLNFPKNAFYGEAKENKDNITPFEFIPWILSNCKNLEEALELLENINLVNIHFSVSLPLSPLHWIISDRKGSVVVESVKDGLHIHKNEIGVLTNNPPFEFQKFNLNNYRNLKVTNGENNFDEKILLEDYCQGLGGIGLPGDVSSMSRFVRASFGVANSVCENDEVSSVSQFFHILNSVSMSRGICKTEGGKWDITVYSSCINTDRGIYYYTTYDNSRITSVNMHNCDLNSNEFFRFPLIAENQILNQN